MHALIAAMAIVTAVAATVLVTVGQAAESPAIPPALELPAGGIVFNARDKLLVEAETLTIALDRIEIDYRLRNPGTLPRTLLFAFPLPLVDTANLFGQGVAMPAFDPANPTNFVGFWSTIDGAAVQPDVDIRAYAVGQADVTATLKQHGLPLYPLGPGLADQLAALPFDVRRNLDEANLIDADVSPPQPLWALKTVFHWRHAIRPETTLAIRHHYKPIAGSAPWSEELKAKAVAKYCLSTDEIDKLDGILARGRAPTAYWVHYAPGHNAWLKGESSSHTLAIERPLGLGIAATCTTGARAPTEKGFQIPSANKTDDTEVFVFFAE